MAGPRDPGQPEPESGCVAKTSDHWGNSVVLGHDQWAHIRRFHPEMANRLKEICETVASPNLISESTIDPEALIFDGYNRWGSSSRIIRVVVRYADRGKAESGSAFGSIGTAYGPLTADTGNVGRVVYFAGLRRRTE